MGGTGLPENTLHHFQVSEGGGKDEEGEENGQGESDREEVLLLTKQLSQFEIYFNPHIPLFFFFLNLFLSYCCLCRFGQFISVLRYSDSVQVPDIVTTKDRYKVTLASHSHFSFDQKL